MTDMIERVARAICASAYDATPESPAALRSDFIERHWRNHVSGARSAIEAMSVPTDEMMRIGDDAVDTCTKVDPCLTPAKHIWADMINAALGEGK